MTELYPLIEPHDDQMRCQLGRVRQEKRTQDRIEGFRDALNEWCDIFELVGFGRRWSVRDGRRRGRLRVFP